MPGFILAAAAVVSVVGGVFTIFLFRARGRSRLEESRAVILHLPIADVWETVRDFPALRAAHGRGRPGLDLRILDLVRGDGAGAGTAWRQGGAFEGRPYEAEFEIVEALAPRRLAVRLVRDSLGTHRLVSDHLCELELRKEGDRTTKLTWRLRARLRTTSARVEARLAPDRLRVRLLDLGLRSIKVALEERPRAGAVARGEGGVAPPAPEASERRLTDRA